MAARRVERTVTTTKIREPRATSRMADGGEEIVPVAKPGMGLGDAMGIVSFLLLVTAILLVDMYLGKQYGEGMFFKP
jgi:hypothetical protein